LPASETLIPESSTTKGDSPTAIPESLAAEEDSLLESDDHWYLSPDASGDRSTLGYIMQTIFPGGGGDVEGDEPAPIPDRPKPPVTIPREEEMFESEGLGSIGNDDEYFEHDGGEGDGRSDEDL
jgi:hypothetical protein